MKTVVRWGVLIALLVVAAIVGVQPHTSYADGVQGGTILGADSSPIKVVIVTSNTASAGNFTAGSQILGFKLYANDAGDSCGLYDVATISGGPAVTTLIDEWYEATDEETNVHMWPRPYQLTTDLSVLTNGVCIIYYQ